MHTNSNEPQREVWQHLHAQSEGLSSHSCRFHRRSTLRFQQGLLAKSRSLLLYLFRWKHCFSFPPPARVLYSFPSLTQLIVFTPSSISLPEQQLWCHKVGGWMNINRTHCDTPLVNAECTRQAPPTNSAGIGYWVLCCSRHGLPRREQFYWQIGGLGKGEDLSRPSYNISLYFMF